MKRLELAIGAVVITGVIGCGVYLLDRPRNPPTNARPPEVPADGEQFDVVIPFYATPDRGDLRFTVPPASVNDPANLSRMLAEGDAFELKVGDRIIAVKSEPEAESEFHAMNRTLVETPYGKAWVMTTNISPLKTERVESFGNGDIDQVEAAVNR